ncbi:MAG: Holliday junction branch migration protein RuvA [Pseudomonadota bacterium]
MIGKIAGRLEMRMEDHVLVDVRGVGYIVYCSERTLSALPKRGEAIALYTDLLVREDNLQLFGFLSLAEKEWHRLLTSVQGIGAKASMAILGALGGEALGRAIALGDWGSVAKAKGVGPKTAQRVVNELKDKAPGVMAMAGAALGAGNATGAAEQAAEDGEVIDVVAPVAPARGGGAEAAALSALQNLGYAPSEAARAVAQVAGEAAGEAAGAGEPLGEAALIRAALKLLAPKG